MVLRYFLDLALPMSYQEVEVVLLDILILKLICQTHFLLSFATCFEDYSDFGSTINFKLATLLKASDNFNIRAALNTGFRAPSLHQLNFNSTSTIFDQNGDPQEVGTFANDSRAADLLGIPQLKEENF